MLKTFLALPARHKLAVPRALYLLAYYRFVPGAESLAQLQATSATDSNAPPAPTQQQCADAQTLGRIVAAAARIAPWESRCLAQSLVTVRLLARARIPASLLLGARHVSETGSATRGLSAHAWVQCGDVIVNGAAGHDGFTALRRFAWSDDATSSVQGL